MLTLEELDYDDRDDLYKLSNYKSIMKWIGNGKVWSRDKIEKLIELQLSDRHDKHRSYFYFKIVLDNTTIGIIGLHPFSYFKGSYLTVFINPQYQGKGYYKKSIELLGDKIRKIKVFKIMVRENNKRMIHVCNKHYFFSDKVKFKNEMLFEYYYFNRPLTYLIKTESFDKSFINSFMKEKGWIPFNYKKHKMPDLLHVDGTFYYDKSLYTIKSLLKNQLIDNKMKITDKKNLYKNLNLVNGMKQHLVENYDTTRYENKAKFKPLFKNNDLWIIKPTESYAGRGIRVVTSYDELQHYFKTIDSLELYKREKNTFVVQKYIVNPLLYNEKKFHLRCHFIVFEGENFYIKEIQTLTAKNKFDMSNLNDKGVHDTHFDGSEKDVYFPSSFKLSKKIKQHIIDQIEKILKAILKLADDSCYPETKRCYQLFGVDFMITDDYTVIILECNSKIGLKTGEKSLYPGTNMTYNSLLFTEEYNHVISKVFPN